MIAKLILLIACLLTSFYIHEVSASGTVDGGTNKDQESGGSSSKKGNYSRGKALYFGEIGQLNCVACHQKLSQTKIRRLKSSVEAFVVDCKKHKPCFNQKASLRDLIDLNTYIKKRYRLKK